MRKSVSILVPNKLKIKIKDLLYKRFGHLNVTRPYIIEIKPENKFKDKVVVVTGGSGVLGRAISCKFAAEGASVYVCGMTDLKIEAVVNEIHYFGGKAHPCNLNVTNAKDIQLKFNHIVEKCGKIDVLVTCAGGSSRGKNKAIVEQEVEVIDSVLEVNLRGTILSTRTASKTMIEKQNGKIIMLSSTIGIGGKIGFSEYAAAKGGIFSYAKSLAMELGGYGINVNCVTPGIVQRDKISHRQLEKIKTTNYLNYYCTPEDIANAVVFLASDEASFITGQNLVVDGGRSLGLKGD